MNGLTEKNWNFRKNFRKNHIETKHVWIASIGYKGKQYRLKRTKDLDAAIKARKEAEEAVKNGDFEKWRIKENQNKDISWEGKQSPPSFLFFDDVWHEILIGVKVSGICVLHFVLHTYT